MTYLSVLLMFGSAPNAFAGSSDGLHLVVVPTDEAEKYTEQLEGFFDRYYDDKTISACNDHRLNIANATIHPKDKLFSAKEILQIDGKKKRKQLATKLRTYRDEYHSEGVDAAIVVYLENDSLVLRSVSAHVPAKIYTERLKLSELSDERAVDLAACKVISQLPITREP